MQNSGLVTAPWGAEWFHTLLEKLPTAAYTCDAEGLLTFYNERMAELWGRKPMLNHPQDRFCGSFKLFSPTGDEIPHDRCWMALALRDGREYSGLEVFIERPDGSRRPVLAHASPLHGRSGELLGAINVLIDIREQKRIERALREQAEELEKLMDIMPVAVWIARDSQCTKITGNRTGYELLRQARGENLSKTPPAGEPGAPFRIFSKGRELANHELPMQYAAATGIEVRDMEEEIVFDDGVVHLFGSAVPLFDADGRPRGSVAAFMDVSELRRLDKELGAKVEQLAEADRRKDEFLAQLAHELRNPLSPITTALQTMRLKGMHGEEQAVLERQVDHLTRLTDDLLDLSRITRGTLRVEKRPLAIDQAVQAAVEASRAAVERLDQTLTVTVPSEPLLVDGDLVRLTQVLTNLLTNAAKFTRRGGRITLNVERSDRYVVIRIADNGVGIAPAELPHVFDMFFQASHEQRALEGLGVGLWLVRHLVELHGGSVEAISAGAGKGSQFIVRLPESQTAMRLAAAEAKPPLDARRYRLLVVDDNVDSADSLAALLAMRGHDVRVAYDGASALTAAEAHRPNVMLLDIGMPSLDGVEVCRRLRREPWGESIFAIAVTGWGRDVDRARTLEAGFDAHLVKPLDSAKLSAALCSYASSARAENRSADKANSTV